MQAPAWLPANAPGIHLAAGLRSNERCRRRDVGANRAACISRCFEALAACPPRHGSAETTLGTVSLIPCMDRRCRLRRGFLRIPRTLIWPLAFAAMDKAAAATFRAWPHVESVSDVAATAIVTDHAWAQNLDSVDSRERITTKVLRLSDYRRAAGETLAAIVKFDRKRKLDSAHFWARLSCDDSDCTFYGPSVSDRADVSAGDCPPKSLDSGPAGSFQNGR